MKIAVRGGHSLDIRGASGFLDEVNEDRKIKDLVIKYLRQMGHEVLDVTPSNSGSSSVDLNYGVSKANSWGADYFCSIHLNAGGGIGTEVLYYSSSNQGKKYAERISSSISSLGFRNRGAKADIRGLYELRHTKMVANIIECFFLDTQSDVDLYRKVGVDVLGKAIAEGITRQATITDSKPKYSVNCCLEFQHWYNRITQTSAPLIEDGAYGPATEKAINTIHNIIKEF